MITLPLILATTMEAVTGFDGQTNGFLPPFEFAEAKSEFGQVETKRTGLGPTYNGQSCRECHQNVVVGGASQTTEHRTGRQRKPGGFFFEAPGGSLIQSRATDPNIVEKVDVEDNIRTFRISTNTLGSGYVEAIANQTIRDIRDAQPPEMRGTVVKAQVIEAGQTKRIGRFGWKSQHSSLLSFSADAYLNEMGITSVLFPEENTSSGRYVGFGTPFDPLPEPEDEENDIQKFADFMRSTKAPSRGPITQEVLKGERTFEQIGCAVCHVPSITTAPSGRKINGGTFTIPAALGNRIIHPYSDFLLHDIGSGDGIPIEPTPEFTETANQLRTAPLWALRTRNRLMHDGLSFTKEGAIKRHQGQAASVTAKFNMLSEADKTALMSFMDSL
jgi:CxxC motif-containing protein (DUF1111 family)